MSELLPFQALNPLLFGLSSTARYSTGSGVATANAGNYYGYTDWNVTDAKDITGKKLNDAASPELKAGELDADIFKIDGKTLKTGDPATGSGTSDATRPKALYDDLVAIKQ